jgi:arylformamidase
MEIIDITVPLSDGMVVYDGDPEVHLERVHSIEDGAVANNSRLDFGVHSGTHIDAPVHFIPGAPAAEDLPLEPLLGPVRVVDATGIEGNLDAEALRSLDVPRAERILFKTRNSRLWKLDHFSPEFVHLTGSGAEELVERGVRLVGLDYLSIGDPDAHRALLGARVIAVEGLDLAGVDAGEYELVCLPLKIVGSDGAPARALLIRD